MHLLIIDDNADTADSLAMLVRIRGHECDVALSGEAALSRLAVCGGYDAVVIDHFMAGLTGLETVARMREGCFPIPVVLTTAADNYVVDTLRMESARLAPVIVLRKPFSVDELLASVKSLVTEDSCPRPA